MVTPFCAHVCACAPVCEQKPLGFWGTHGLSLEGSGSICSGRPLSTGAAGVLMLLPPLPVLPPKWTGPLFLKKKSLFPPKISYFFPVSNISVLNLSLKYTFEAFMMMLEKHLT